ncbi:hypothetical protein Tsubulata_000721 [Turnera subulata]|uniref:Uncharacterized protein n=1 Tax=Turnera subulata TaxID=218843 RepID=A0A9Q0F7B4_9ROSI|nr:hypothetical protein Tsubulata_000721 [Turnera subulata]
MEAISVRFALEKALEMGFTEPVTCLSDLLQSEKCSSSRKNHHKPPGARAATNDACWRCIFITSMAANILKLDADLSECLNSCSSN